jgi:DNA-binding MarR family transcriptional regulator
MNGNMLEERSIAFGNLYRRMLRLLDRRLAEQGASLERTKLLFLLDRQGPKSAAEIADFFGKAPRTVTEAIDGMERIGLVRRDPDPVDRRVKRISLTEEGRRAVKATEPLRTRIINEVFGVLTEAEGVQLSALIAKLTAAVEAQEGR